MEQAELVAIDEIVASAAKRLDKVLCKYGKANGQVTKANFSVVGAKNVSLQGSELSKVGTGYSATGETIEEKINSLVDAVEEELAASCKPVKESKKKVEEPKGEEGEGGSESEGSEDEEKVESLDADKIAREKKAKKAAAEKARRQAKKQAKK